MRSITYSIGGIIILALGACASAPSTEVAKPKLALSQEARELVMAQGRAAAAGRGYSTNSQLVCDVRKRTGSHMVEKFCYTRAEAKQARINLQDDLRSMRTDTHVCGADPGSRC